MLPSDRDSHNRLFATLRLAALLGFVSLMGMPASRPPLAAEPAGTAELQAGERPTRVLSDNWDAMFLQEAKAGYGRTRTTEITEGQRVLHQTDATARMRFKRFGQSIEIVMTMQTTETADGRLVDFRTEMAFGPAPMVTAGRVVDGKLKLTTTTQGKVTTSEMPWSDDYRGFFYAERSLASRPMKPGERRTFKALVPVFNRIATTELEAGESEETKMLDGTRRLLKITSTTKLAGTSIKSFLWTDDAGQTMKTLETSMGQTSYRTTKELALKDNDGVVPDLIVGTVVRVKGDLRRPHTARQVRYRVLVKDANAANLFPNGTSQSVKAVADGGAELLVRRVQLGDNELPATDADDRPTASDTKPSSFIQSDDKAVVALAAEVVPDDKDPATIAKALEGHVNRVITKKDFSTALATAAEVARSRQGDCSEHAVLLAALARARGLPARTAVGLVFARSLDGFGYHMWTEVWIDDHWIPLDATRPRGGTGGGHIKIAHSNLDNASGMSAFLPVLKVMGKLSIEVVEEND